MATDKCDPTADIDTLERHRDQAVELFEAFERRLNELTAVLPESDSRELARWGGEIATAAIAHLAQSTPARWHFQSSAFHEYHTHAIAEGGPEVSGGVMRAPDRPGLGVEPDMDVLGSPVAVISG